MTTRYSGFEHEDERIVRELQQQADQITRDAIRKRDAEYNQLRAAELRKEIEKMGHKPVA